MATAGLFFAQQLEREIIIHSGRFPKCSHRLSKGYIAMQNTSSGSGILSGMRIVEASAFVAAPLGGMTLAQLGADVIRIDNIGGGLDYRRWPVTEDNVSLFWAGLNKSKRSVAINFRDPEGSALAKQIITAPGKEAGMLLTNFPPKAGCPTKNFAHSAPTLFS